MSNKKNIDRLFQEKFKDFDVKPDPKVWQNIQSKLKEEEDKPVIIIPLWLKLSGIVASLALALFLGKSIFSPIDNLAIPSTVDTEKINNNIDKDTTLDKNLEKVKSNNQTNNTNKEKNRQTVFSQESLLEDTNNNVTNSESKKTSSKRLNYNQTKNTVTSTEALKKPINKYKSNRGNSNSNQVNNKTTIAQNSNLEIKNDTGTNNLEATAKNKTSIENTKSIEKNKLNTEINTTQKDKALAKNDLTKENTEKQKPSIEDAIAENNNTEDLIEKEEVDNRWSVNANIAPVYYNTFGEGSHIHEQFNTNNKSGEINTSYGVKVGYALNDKLTVRSGINRLNLSYDTDDVIVYEKVSANSNNSLGLKNVDFTTNLSGQELSMISASNVSSLDVSRSLNAAISQRMNYFEVPLELEYRLSNKRFGVNLIGGISTFILNDNQVVSELNGTKTQIGEANNINPISFSTNLGIGLNYRFSDAVIFNIEPTFKYQLNAFSETSGNFNPYIIGLYTGFSYRF